VNVITPTLVGLITFRLGGDYLVAAGVIALTFVLLIFCEVAPKTFGAPAPGEPRHPRRLRVHAAARVLYPLVWATNLLANGVLASVGRLAQQPPPR